MTETTTYIYNTDRSVTIRYEYLPICETVLTQHYEAGSMTHEIPASLLDDCDDWRIDPRKVALMAEGMNYNSSEGVLIISQDDWDWSISITQQLDAIEEGVALLEDGDKESEIDAHASCTYDLEQHCAAWIKALEGEGIRFERDEDGNYTVTK